MIVYLLIGVIFWLMVLTLFVVKLTNKDDHTHDHHEIHSTETKLKKVITNIHKESEETKPPLNLDQLTTKLDEHLKNTSREEMQEWLHKDQIILKEDNNKTLPGLNEGYKAY